MYSIWPVKDINAVMGYDCSLHELILEGPRHLVLDIEWDTRKRPREYIQDVLDHTRRNIVGPVLEAGKVTFKIEDCVILSATRQKCKSGDQFLYASFHVINHKVVFKTRGDENLFGKRLQMEMEKQLQPRQYCIDMSPIGRKNSNMRLPFQSKIGEKETSRLHVVQNPSNIEGALRYSDCLCQAFSVSSDAMNWQPCKDLEVVSISHKMLANLGRSAKTSKEAISYCKQYCLANPTQEALSQLIHPGPEKPPPKRLVTARDKLFAIPDCGKYHQTWRVFEHVCLCWKSLNKSVTDLVEWVGNDRFVRSGY